MDDQTKIELKGVLRKFASISNDAEKQEVLDEFHRLGQKIDVERLKKVIACGCGPSGERGVEDGLCPT